MCHLLWISEGNIKRGNQKKDQVIFQIETHIDSFPSRMSHYSRHKNESVRYLSADYKQNV